MRLFVPKVEEFTSSGCETKTKKCQIIKLAENVQINLWKKGRWGKKIENKFLGYNSTQNY